MPPDTKAESPKPLSADGNLPAFSPDGVDLSLIRWMLSLTPAERLAVLQANVTSILRLRDAASRP
jgi:hypothetical protein